ncbi:hypothetical protein C8R46DRAFT_1343666 [Mycena filopes]|nr:hypothetical protein C8R46DRAFT_1343666 [Mycena filopes]
MRLAFPFGPSEPASRCGRDAVRCDAMRHPYVHGKKPPGMNLFRGPRAHLTGPAYIYAPSFPPPPSISPNDARHPSPRHGREKHWSDRSHSPCVPSPAYSHRFPRPLSSEKAAAQRPLRGPTYHPRGVYEQGSRRAQKLPRTPYQRFRRERIHWASPPRACTLGASRAPAARPAARQRTLHVRRGGRRPRAWPAGARRTPHVHIHPLPATRPARCHSAAVNHPKAIVVFRPPRSARRRLPRLALLRRGLGLDLLRALRLDDAHAHRRPRVPRPRAARARAPPAVPPPAQRAAAGGGAADARGHCRRRHLAQVAREAPRTRGGARAVGDAHLAHRARGLDPRGAVAQLRRRGARARTDPGVADAGAYSDGGLCVFCVFR